ncbi:MAG: hypothetical protein NVSMB9_07440 [Isosphaeraceae bacterium]
MVHATGKGASTNPNSALGGNDRFHSLRRHLRYDVGSGRVSGSDLDFSAFSNTLRDELSPESSLEDVLADRVILAAWRLRLISRDETESLQQDAELLPIARETLRVECSLETALDLLHTARRHREPRWGRAVHPVSNVNASPPEVDDFSQVLDDADYSNEWPTIPGDESDRTDDENLYGTDEDQEVSGSPPTWTGRLIFDFNVSDTSPVVKGTWVTVGHVVSLIVDGWSWSDILRSHPELTEDDIRACLSYNVEQDTQGDY